MRNKIKSSATLVYQGGKKTVQLVKKSTTQALISKYYELSEETEPRLKLKDAWAMYKRFQISLDMAKLDKGLA